MLSRQAIRRWQWGQLDGGWNSERSFLSSFARRRMHTLRKLPKQSPRTAAPTRNTARSAPTQHLVEKDPRCHGDVERLRTLCQRDCDAPRGDGVQSRPDPRPLVADDHRDALPSPPPPGPGGVLPRALGGWPVGGDRKSPRLNPSHLVSSYAGFGLKK